MHIQRRSLAGLQSKEAARPQEEVELGKPARIQTLVCSIFLLFFLFSLSTSFYIHSISATQDTEWQMMTPCLFQVYRLWLEPSEPSQMLSQFLILLLPILISALTHSNSIFPRQEFWLAQPWSIIWQSRYLQHFQASDLFRVYPSIPSAFPFQAAEQFPFAAVE